MHHAKIEEERCEEGFVMDIWKELEAEGVNRHLLAEVRSFRDAHGVAEEVRGRIPNPRFLYYG